MIPPYLKKGDCVAIVATARKVTLEGLEPAMALLKNWGLTVFIGATIGKENNQLAGTDQERADDFQQALDNPEVKAIWCAKGGYGTVRIIDLLDFSGFRKNPKWVIGFSDVTVLHSHINNINIPTLHGIMCMNVSGASAEATGTMQKALFGEKLDYSIPPHIFNKNGKAVGVVVGGNLSVLYSILGSPSALDCEDKILFIEDLDEYLYHIDRMMMNLKRNGCFNNIKGLIVGGMTQMHDNDIPWGKDALEIVREHMDEYNLPVCFNFPGGHIFDNRAVIFGKQVTLEVTANGTQIIF